MVESLVLGIELRPRNREVSNRNRELSTQSRELPLKEEILHGNRSRGYVLKLYGPAHFRGLPSLAPRYSCRYLQWNCYFVLLSVERSDLVGGPRGVEPPS